MLRVTSVARFSEWLMVLKFREERLLVSFFSFPSLLNSMQNPYLVAVILCVTNHSSDDVLTTAPISSIEVGNNPKLFEQIWLWHLLDNDCPELINHHCENFFTLVHFTLFLTNSRSSNNPVKYDTAQFQLDSHSLAVNHYSTHVPCIQYIGNQYNLTRLADESTNYTAWKIYSI